MGDMQGEDVIYTRQTKHITNKNRNNTKLNSVEAEFLKNHYDLAHLHPLNMQAMANKGGLPKIFVRCKLPMCSACMYGKATRKAWRRRTKNNTGAAGEPKQPR